MRVMVMVKATKDSAAGMLPSAKLLLMASRSAPSPATDGGLWLPTPCTDGELLARVRQALAA